MTKWTFIATACVIASIMSACSSHTDYSFYQVEQQKQVQQAYELGDLDLAEGHLRRYLKQYPTDTASWLRLGNVLMKQQNYQAAQQAYSKVTQLDQDNVLAWQLLAWSHVRLATEASIQADFHSEDSQPLPLLLWLLEGQKNKF